MRRAHGAESQAEVPKSAREAHPNGIEYSISGTSTELHMKATASLLKTDSSREAAVGCCSRAVSGRSRTFVTCARHGRRGKRARRTSEACGSWVHEQAANVVDQGHGDADERGEIPVERGSAAGFLVLLHQRHRPDYDHVDQYQHQHHGV